MSVQDIPVVFGAKPYQRLSELPGYIKKKPKGQQRQWRAVFNSLMAKYGDEGRAFAGANAVIGHR